MKNLINILGVRIDSITFDQAIKEVLLALKSNQQHHFSTPNPEILVEASKNKKFKKILNNCTLNTPDGIGIILISKLLKKTGKLKEFLKERVTGTDLTIKLIKLSKIYNYKIFFLGASDISNKKTVEFAKKHNANIAGNYCGNPKDPECIKHINQSKPDLLFVAFGAPAQEIWIAKNLNQIKSVKVAIGIGGAFDFISKTRKSAPLLLRKIGLEWLYRLIIEPSRIKRILTATIIFPIKALLHKNKY